MNRDRQDQTGASSHAEDCSNFWSNTVRSRISQLEDAVLRPVPSHIIDDADTALRDAKRELLLQFEHEKAAIARAEQELYEVYEARRQSIDAALLVLRQQHNSRVPAASIPPELLASIFLFLAEVDAPQRLRTESYESCSSFGWLAVTYTCRRWRQVALEHQSLWVNISLPFGQDWAATFVKRARNSILSFEFDARPEPFWQTALVNENIWRTQSLCIGIHRNTLAALHAPITLLNEIFLSFWSSSNTPDSCMGGCSPTLRHLRVFADGFCDIPWTSPLFTHLVTLDLRDAGDWNPPPPLRDILDAMERMHALEDLKINLSLLTADVIQFLDAGPLRVVSVPRMDCLDVVSSFQDAQIFLAHLSLPSAANVACQLHLDVTEPLDVELAEVYDNGLESMSAGEHTSKYRRRIARLEVIFTATSFKTNTWRHDGSPALSVEADMETEWDPIFIIQKALDAFSSESLKELSLVLGSFRADSMLSLDWNRHAPAVRRLTVDGNVALSLCVVLTPWGRADFDPSDAAHCVLPALTTLVLVGVRLDCNEETSMEESPARRLADTLVGCLAARAEAGYRLDELDVVQCDVDEEWVRLVRKASLETKVLWRIEPEIGGK
ncbi:hypothetical protein FA95DRAFT_1566578 [Auriscalpium vulgare]|uniref:Uncharacterized protein n=1 Tax=Auriscalpium vulgare TaxID=40419 RepID=A0ACB8R7X3_9AGAM|nr:hypothetical protein FA95DRAFT_1566578 [Auriscalpium vulgare]